jgi:ABC-type transport system involved in multi-copper enzyme maturation permease subunit
LKIAAIDFMPVVRRELREGARRPFNYWLRVIGAAAGVVLLYVLHQNGGGDLAADGLRLFTGLHEMLLVLICVMVPAMSADCIAREKREGTLGLLFVTPLKAMGVVVGKGLVQAFRAFTLWLAVLPVIIIPFLSGGVTPGDAASAVTIEFCLTLLCLAAGILASSVAKARSTAFILAASFAVAFVCLFGGFLGLGFLSQTSGLPAQGQWQEIRRTGQLLITGQSLGSSVIAGLPVISTSSGIRTFLGPRIVTFSSVPVFSTTVSIGPYGSFGYPVAPAPAVAFSPSGWSATLSNPATREGWRSLLLESLLATPLLFWLVLRFAARQVARSWQDKPPSVRREGWVRTFCAPLAKRRFARKMRETLEWNPIAWLQQYSWKARVSKWGLCLGLVMIEWVFSADSAAMSASDLQDAQSVMMLILAAAFTFVGVNSFLTEKKSGALELLLVTPVTPIQIIWGRVWGLWKQFLPAGLTLLLLSIYAYYLGDMSGMMSSKEPHGLGGMIWDFLTWPLPHEKSDWIYNESLAQNTTLKIFIIASGFLTLPVYATYFALRVKNLIVAAGLTWITLLLCPFFAFAANAFFVDHSSVEPLFLEVVESNFIFAMVACFLLSHSLSRRIYSF